MADRRLVPVLSALGRLGADQTATWSRVCMVGAQLLAVEGAGVMLQPSPSRSQASLVLGGSDEVAEALAEAQFTLGEGPCVDAVRTQLPVEVPDLDPAAATRWLAFSQRAAELGVRAVFSLPLRVGVVRLGSLDLYRRRPGALDDGQFADALAVAELISHTIVAKQANAPPGRLAQELEGNELGDVRARVQQAAGVLSARLGIGVADALVRLRAHAYAGELSIGAVAAQVMDGTLRLDEDFE
jgi:hypothetical protein